MRGGDEETGSLFSYRSPEVPGSERSSVAGDPGCGERGAGAAVG